MLASKRELQDIEQQQMNSVIMSDQLKDILSNPADDVSAFESQVNFIYIFSKEDFYKARFVSYETLSKYIVIDFICKSEVLEVVHNKAIDKIIIEYNPNFVIEKKNLGDVKSSFKIKYLSDDSYLVTLKIKEV